MIPNEISPSLSVNHFAKLLFRMPVSFTTEGGLKVVYLDIDEVETFSYGTRSASYPPAADKYHFDRVTGKLSYNGTFSTDPTIVTASCFIGTKGSYLSADPRTEGDLYYFNPIVMEVPKKKIYLSDSIIGYTPIQTSTLIIATTDFKELKYFFNASTLNAKLEVYQCVGEVKAANIKKVFTGLCGNFKIMQNYLSIDIHDQYSIFQQSFAPVTYFDLGQNITIPFVYGSVYGIRAGLRYLQRPDNPSLHQPTYRIGYFRDGQKGQDGLGLVWSENTVGGLPNATTTTVIIPTYMQDIVDLRVGDRLAISSAINELPFGGGSLPMGTLKYAEITGVSVYSPTHTLITHTTIDAIASTRPFIWYSVSARAVNIVMQNHVYKAYPWRDYSEFVPIGDSSAEISFKSGYHTSLGLPAFLGENDLVYVVRGIGSDVDNPVDFLKFLLTDHLSVSLSEIDSTVFDEIAEDFEDHKIGMCIPEAIGAAPPTYHEVLTNILQSCLLRLHLNDDGQWTLTRIAPMGVEDGIDFYDDSSVLAGSTSYEFNFDDIITEVKVTYNHREIAVNPLYGGGTYDEVKVNSAYAEALHGVKRYKEVQSYFVSKNSAELLANRLLYVFSERRCQARISAPPAFNEIDIGMKCRSKKNEGRNIQYTDVDQASTGVVVSVDRSERKVEVVIDDQLGIERNKVNWNA